MRISMYQRGGLAGLDRQIEVDGATVKVTDKKRRGRHRTSYPAPLDSTRQARVESLASQVAAVSDKVVGSGEDLPSDAMITELAIEDGGQRHQLRLISGDDAPGEVWELMGMLGQVSEPG